MLRGILIEAIYVNLHLQKLEKFYVKIGMKTYFQLLINHQADLNEI